MNIEYTYKITLVNDTLQYMEVEYSADGYDAITVGMPIPFNDIPLTEFIRTYAPTRIWENSTKTLQQVLVGATGVVKPLQIGDSMPEVPATAPDTAGS
jgi:hypothetical protein